MTNARNVLGRFIQYVPFWVIFLSALALGLGTAFGYEKIVTTLGEKMGSAHMNPAQGTAAQASAMIGIGLANFGGMPVSTTHVLSAAVLGSVAGTKGEKVNMHTVGKIAMTWVTTLPGTVIVSFILSVVFYLALVVATARGAAPRAVDPRRVAVRDIRARVSADSRSSRTASIRALQGVFMIKNLR